MRYHKVNLEQTSIRELNQQLHTLQAHDNYWQINNSNGGHNIAIGLRQHAQIEIYGSVGYYCGGLNQNADLTIYGHAGAGVAENILSGSVRIHGNVAQYAAASGQGGLVVIDGNAGARCGIAMKGVDIVVKGSVGYMSAFMAQKGHLVIGGNAADGLGESLYDALIFIAGRTKELGQGCIELPMDEARLSILKNLLDRAEFVLPASQFRCYGPLHHRLNPIPSMISSIAETQDMV